MTARELHPVVFFDKDESPPGVVDMRAIYERVPPLARGENPVATASQEAAPPAETADSDTDTGDQIQPATEPKKAPAPD